MPEHLREPATKGEQNKETIGRGRTVGLRKDKRAARRKPCREMYMDGEGARK